MVARRACDTRAAGGLWGFGRTPRRAQTAGVLANYAVNENEIRNSVIFTAKKRGSKAPFHNPKTNIKPT